MRNINLESKREKDLTGGLSRIAIGPTSWCSKIQVEVALFIQKSKLYSAALSFQGGIEHNQMIGELRIKYVKPRTV